MLEPGDRVVLAAGVELCDGSLVDRVAATTWPLNETASHVVQSCGRPLSEVAEELACVFDRPAGSCREDVLAFVWALNRHALVNVERSTRPLARTLSWLRLAARLLPAGVLPPLVARRRALDTSTWARAFASASAAAAGRGLALGAGAFVAVGHVALLAGEGVLAPPLAAALAVGGGLVLHEASHAALLVGVPSALVLQGRRTFLVHAPTSRHRRAMVAGAGPLVTASVGVALVAAAIWLAAPMLVVAGGTAAAHALGLTVLTSDGRIACGL